MYCMHLGDCPRFKDGKVISNIRNGGDSEKDNSTGAYLIELEGTKGSRQQYPSHGSATQLQGLLMRIASCGCW